MIFTIMLHFSFLLVTIIKCVLNVYGQSPKYVAINQGIKHTERI